MSLIENVRDFFNRKRKNETTKKAPEGVCPNCWGQHEYDGEFYSFMKGQNDNPSKEIYNSFIADVVRKLDKIIINKNTYTCETCQVKYE